jgi:hypothetical protein
LIYQNIGESIRNKRPKPKPETEFYLVNLLEQFIKTDRLFAKDANGHYQQEPLALMLKQALETPSESEARLIYQNIGDISLYVSGFFQESLKTKIVDTHYYIGMGQAAYDQAARLEERGAIREALDELAARFGWFVEVLNDLSLMTLSKSEQDIVRLYESWIQSGDQKSEKILNEVGIQTGKWILPKSKVYKAH